MYDNLQDPWLDMLTWYANFNSFLFQLLEKDTARNLLKNIHHLWNKDCFWKQKNQKALEMPFRVLERLKYNCTHNPPPSEKKYYFVSCCYCLCILKIQPFSWPNITFVTLWKFMQISASRTWNYFFPVLLSLKMPRVKTPKNEALWKFSELIERLILKCALISFRPDCPTRKCICCSREFVQHQKH